MHVCVNTSNTSKALFLTQGRQHMEKVPALLKPPFRHNIQYPKKIMNHSTNQTKPTWGQAVICGEKKEREREREKQLISPLKTV